MLEKIVDLSENAYFKTYIIEISQYIQSGDSNSWQPKKRPAVVVIPGGGYKYIADSEDEPVIYHFLSKGYSCFSLHYSINEASKYPLPLFELFRTIAYIRQNADIWGIDSDAIVICGFSAGGHLAGMCATQYHLSEWHEGIGLEEKQIKPNAVVLCYPITNIERLKRENSRRVSGWGAMLNEENARVNVVDFVTNKMCPTFIWHTRTDGIVPVSQSLELIEKMIQNNVSFEGHVFGKGYHGLSTNDVLSNYQGAIQNGVIVPNVSRWIDMCSDWINDLFSFNV